MQLNAVFWMEWRLESGHTRTWYVFNPFSFSLDSRRPAHARHSPLADRSVAFVHIHGRYGGENTMIMGYDSRTRDIVYVNVHDLATLTTGHLLLAARRVEFFFGLRLLLWESAIAAKRYRGLVPFGDWMAGRLVGWMRRDHVLTVRLFVLRFFVFPPSSFFCIVTMCYDTSSC
jgi:hypothetical protein